MRVRVLFFGILRDLSGAAERILDLPEAATVEDVIGAASAGAGGSSIWKSIAVAVNQEYAGRRRVLRDGDEVALLPPVSGGLR